MIRNIADFTAIFNSSGNWKRHDMADCNLPHCKLAGMLGSAVKSAWKRLFVKCSYRACVV
jgi:hypothetical protein